MSCGLYEAHGSWCVLNPQLKKDLHYCRAYDKLWKAVNMCLHVLWQWRNEQAKEKQYLSSMLLSDLFYSQLNLAWELLSEMCIKEFPTSKCSYSHKTSAIPWKCIVCYFNNVFSFLKGSLVQISSLPSSQNSKKVYKPEKFRWLEGFLVSDLPKPSSYSNGLILFF